MKLLKSVVSVRVFPLHVFNQLPFDLEKRQFE